MFQRRIPGLPGHKPHHVLYNIEVPTQVEQEFMETMLRRFEKEIKKITIQKNKGIKKISEIEKKRSQKCRIRKLFGCPALKAAAALQKSTQAVLTKFKEVKSDLVKQNKFQDYYNFRDVINKNSETEFGMQDSEIKIFLKKTLGLPLGWKEHVDVDTNGRFHKRYTFHGFRTDSESVQQHGENPVRIPVTGSKNNIIWMEQ